jgi:hypothetical protein
MARNHEGYAYDFRQGGQIERPKPKAKASEKAASRRKPVGDLTAKKRKALAASTFGLPEQRKYPMPDKSHAANAKARATQMVKKGKLSAAAKARIDAKANRILGRSAEAQMADGTIKDVYD